MQTLKVEWTQSLSFSDGLAVYHLVNLLFLFQIVFTCLSHENPWDVCVHLDWHRFDPHPPAQFGTQILKKNTFKNKSIFIQCLLLVPGLDCSVNLLKIWIVVCTILWWWKSLCCTPKLVIFHLMTADSSSVDRRAK